MSYDRTSKRFTCHVTSRFGDVQCMEMGGPHWHGGSGGKRCISQHKTEIDGERASMAALCSTLGRADEDFELVVLLCSLAQISSEFTVNM